MIGKIIISIIIFCILMGIINEILTRIKRDGIKIEQDLFTSKIDGESK